MSWSQFASKYYSERTDDGAADEDCAAKPEYASIKECVERQANAAREAKKGEYDLAAQQEMAYWTPWAFLGSVVTAFIALIGVAYVHETLLETRRIGQAQVKAYLTVTGGSYEIWGNDLRIEIFIRNVGASPAKSVHSKTIATISLQDDSRIDITTRWCSDIPSQGDGIVMGTLNAPNDQGSKRFFEYVGRRLGFGIEGVVVWNDVFDMRNEQPFRLTSDYERTEEGIDIGALRPRVIGDEVAI